MAIPSKNSIITLPTSESLSLSSYSFYSFEGLSGIGIVDEKEDYYFALDTKNDLWYYYDESVGGYTLSDNPNNFTIPYISPTIEISDLDQIINFNFLINSFLNETASSYGYDSIDNAISYYNSTDPTKREEARSFSDWRDSVLSLADTNIYGFTADGITLPDLAGFTGQDGYIDFSVIGIPTTLVGDENAGYHITDLENKIFTAWTKSNSASSGFGTIQIPFPSGQIKNIYSITGLVDQGGLTSNWLISDYTIKIKMGDTQNSFGTYTEFDYKINDVENNTVSYSDIHLRFNIIGGF